MEVTRASPWRDVVSALSGAQKSNVNAAAYSRWVNRPAGRLLAATAYKLGMTPDQVTALSACASFAGVAVIAVYPPTPLVGIVVALLLVVGYALDSADGQLARLRGGGKPSGEWLDHVIDCAKVASVHLGVLVAWYRHGDGWPAASLFIPLLFSLQQSVYFFGMVLTDLLMRNAGVRPNRPQSGAPAGVRGSLLALPMDYGLLCLLFLLYGWPGTWRWAYAALLVLNVLALAVQLVRWRRRMAALPAR